MFHKKTHRIFFAFTFFCMLFLCNPAKATLLNYDFSGEFLETGCSDPEPDLCGPYSGAFVVDTELGVLLSNPSSAIYELNSGTVTFANNDVLSNASIVISNDEPSDPFDGLIVLIGGSFGEFKLSFQAPPGTISDFLLTEFNVTALIGSATDISAYCKFCEVSSGTTPSDLNPLVTPTSISEPSLLALLVLGLAGIGSRRPKATQMSTQNSFWQ